MSTVKIVALGPLRDKITHEQKVELPTELCTAFELVAEKFGIPKTQARMAFIINGRMQKGSTILQADDEIKVLTMGGAG